MLINNRGSAFSFNFPKGFFQPEIIEWADPYIRRKPMAYQSLEAYMSSTVQSVTFPNLQADVVTQQAFGKERAYKNARWSGDLYASSISVTMKLLSGFFNYWVWQRTFLVYHQLYAQNQVWFEPVTLRFLDEDGYVTQAITLKRLSLTGISEVTLDYTSNSPEFKTFNVDFRYNEIYFDTEES